MKRDGTVENLKVNPEQETRVFMSSPQGGITITKHPTEIQSLRSSCIGTQEFSSGPKQSRLRLYGSLDMGQATQGEQQRQTTPDIIENGVFLKQKYSQQPKRKKPNSKTLLESSKPKSKQAKENSKSKIVKCQSMIVLTNTKPKKKTLAKATSQSPKKHKSSKKNLQISHSQSQQFNIRQLLERSEARERHLQQQKSIIQNQLKKLKQRQEDWLDSVNQRIRLRNAAKVQVQSPVSLLRCPWGANEQRIKEFFEKNLQQRGFQVVQGGLIQVKPKPNPPSRKPRIVLKLPKSQSKKTLESPPATILTKTKVATKYSRESLKDFIEQKHRAQLLFRLQGKLLEKHKQEEIHEKLKKLDEDVKHIFMKKRKNATHKHFATDSRPSNVEAMDPINNEDFERLYDQYKLIMQEQLLSSRASGKVTQKNSTTIRDHTKHLKKKFSKLKSRFDDQITFDEELTKIIVLNSQALKIQKVWRGYITRKILNQILMENNNNNMSPIRKIQYLPVARQSSQESLQIQTNFEPISPEPRNEMISQVINELSALSPEQMNAFTQMLSSFKKNIIVIPADKQDQIIQTSLEVSPRSRLEAKKEISSEKEFNDARRRSMQDNKIDISSISNKQTRPYMIREQAIEYRYRTQLKHLDNHFASKQISPKTFSQKKKAIEQWAKKEREELIKLKELLEKGQHDTEVALRRSKRDMKYVEKLDRNEINLLTNNLSEVSCQPSDNFQTVQASQREIDVGALDSSDFQFSVPNSPKLDQNKISSISHSDYIFCDPNEVKKAGIVIKSSKSEIQSQQLQVLQNNSPTHNSVPVIVLDSKLLHADTEKQVQVSPISGDEKDVFIMSMEYMKQDPKPLIHVEIQDEDPPQMMMESIKTVLQPGISMLKIESVSMLILQETIEEAAQEFSQQPIFNDYVRNLQYQSLLSEDRPPAGIQTNLGVINDFIINLCNFILRNHLNTFIIRMNYPYGILPKKRLRIIHGYSSINDNSFESTQTHISQDQMQVRNNFYALEDEIFIEFEAMTQQELQGDPNLREYEHTHNKAIFDAFNETLNIFRPFYLVNGMPYPWTYSEKHLTVIIINELNIQILFEKVKQKVLEYASSLCGLIQDDDNPTSFQVESSEADEQKQEPNYIQAIKAIQKQDGDYVGQIREERLQKVLLQEINENEYKWYLQDDEKTEVMMEVTDYIFEDLIEELIDELQSF